MKQLDFVKRLLFSYSGSERNIVIPESLIKVAGDLQSAALLNQCIYYTDITKRTDGYFYKTYKEWQEEIYLSKYQVNKIIGRFEKLGIVETKKKKANGAPTIHYRVNMENLIDLMAETFEKLDENSGKTASDVESKETSLSKVKKLNNGKLRNLTMESKETSQTLTENYTENYTETDRQQKSTNNIKSSNKEKNSVSQSFFDYWQKNGYGTLSPYMFGKLNAWIKDFEELGSKDAENILILALEIGIEKNKRNYSFINGVLKNWYNKSLTSVESIKANEAERQSQRNQKNNGYDSGIDQLEAMQNDLSYWT